MPTELAEYYSDRFTKDKNGYWDAIHELRFYNILNQKLGYQRDDITREAPTLRGKKSADFAVDEARRIFFEVKSLNPEDYEIARKGGSIGSDEIKMERCFRKALKKFTKNSVNIVVVADGDTLRLPLSLNPIFNLKDIPSRYFDLPEYNTIGAVVVLAANYWETLLDYRVWFNPNAVNVVSGNVRALLEKNAVPHLAVSEAAD